jgi:6-phosphogluconolactonase
MIRIYPNQESLSLGAARLFVRQAGLAVKAHSRFSVALSGGRTPQRTYELLAQLPFRDQVAWSQTHVFWGDERCVPPKDPRSNARMARLLLLEQVPIPRHQIHPIFCARSPKEAAQDYEDLLRSFFGEGPPRLDLIFLGLGEDGHTASLFPQTPVLKEGKRWAAEIYLPQQDLYRVTLTPHIINHAAVVAFLVAGPTKASILKEVLEGSRHPHRYPGQFIHPSGGRLQWLVDKEAASQLSRAPLRAGSETAVSRAGQK